MDVKLKTIGALLLCGMTSCSPVKKIAGVYRSYYGQKLEFLNDSSFVYDARTDAGLTEYSAGRYSVRKNNVFLMSSFNKGLKNIDISVTTSGSQDNYTTLHLKQKQPNDALAFEIRINGQKWNAIKDRLQLSEKVQRIQLRAFLPPNVLYGTVQSIDTLTSKEFRIADNEASYQHIEISVNADSRDLYRVAVNDTLKIVGKKRLTGNINRHPVAFLKSK